MATQILTTNTQSQSMGINNFASGQIVSDAGTPAAATITVGFVPRWIKFINHTDRITDEWVEGMAAASSLHVVADGTQTLETSHGITVGTDGTFTVDSTTMAASKVFYWVALG